MSATGASLPCAPSFSIRVFGGKWTLAAIDAGTKLLLSLWNVEDLLHESGIDIAVRP
jgi:hypothetical protein